MYTMDLTSDFARSISATTRAIHKPPRSVDETLQPLAKVDRVFAFLVRVSPHAKIKLRAVAQELVNERNSARATR